MHAHISKINYFHTNYMEKDQHQFISMIYNIRNSYFLENGPYLINDNLIVYLNDEKKQVCVHNINSSTTGDGVYIDGRIYITRSSSICQLDLRTKNLIQLERLTSNSRCSSIAAMENFLLFIDKRDILWKMDVKTQEVEVLGFEQCYFIFTFLDKVLLECRINDEKVVILGQFKNGRITELNRLSGELGGKTYWSDNHGVSLLRPANQIIDMNTCALMQQNDKITRDHQFFHKVLGATYFPDFSEQLSKQFLKHITRQQRADEYIQSLNQPHEKKILFLQLDIEENSKEFHKVNYKFIHIYRQNCQKLQSNYQLQKTLLQMCVELFECKGIDCFE
uniref:Uncharacterized protein n=1 Tax=Trepomonas sp. PC1 TaxID=1076344 RepID=A0A146JZM0_9EUKA|eukprot:JAP90130.1 Hypothetical protein TPC1_30375 [Trepomonas sp. PC1]